MAKILEITVKCGKTVNIGNYENVKLSVAYAVELSPEDNADRVTDELYNQAVEKIRQYEELVRTKKHGKKIVNDWAVSIEKYL